jgi:hypothetical protein
LVAADGGIFSFGNAHFDGSMGGTRLNAPVVGMAADPATGGYWLVAQDGGVFSFDAPFHGSDAGTDYYGPVVGMAVTPTIGSYWLVRATGNVSEIGLDNVGTLADFGTMHLAPHNTPMVGMADDPTTGGYWEVASTGGVFSFNAPFHGSMGGTRLNAPVVGMAIST